MTFEGKILYCNQFFCTNSGFLKEETINNNFIELLTPESSKFFENVIKDSLANQSYWKGELKHIRKDNTTYWSTCSFTKVTNIVDNNAININGYLIIEDEINALKEITNQLEFRANLLYEEKLKIETILNNIPYSIIVIEQDGTIIYENEVFKSSFKNEIQRELLINSNIDSYPPNIIVESIKLMMNANEKKEMIVNLKSNISLQINVISLSLNGEDSIFITVIRDITNFVEFDLLQKQFVTSVSHELRTPIASILLSINNYISYKEKLNEEQNRNLLQIIQQNANVLKNIVEDLLIISHIDNKKLQVRNWTKINISLQIKQVLMQLKPLLDAKNLEFNLNCDESIFLFSDKERFDQIIRIPVENAIKYSHKNQKIIIEVYKNYKGVLNISGLTGIVIKISDFGIGIKSEELKFMFKRFFRGSNVQNIQGTGIGLSILKEIVSLLNGQVNIESKENVGTEIIIFLPIIENLES